jgi:hypothetical protein
MKTVDKILLTTFASILAVLISCLIALRILTPGSAFQKITEPGKEINLEYDYKDFDAVSLSDAWVSDIKYGTNFKVILEVPEGLTNILEVSRNGKILEIGLDYRARIFGQYHLLAHIVMPALSRIELSGSSSIDISGFHGRSFETEASGASKLTGDNNYFQEVKLEVSGASRIDLSKSPSVNASAQVSGASSIFLDMRGGSLTGDAGGASVISYRGSVSTKNVQTSGMSKVKEEN